MNMLTMLAILTVVYFSTLLALCFFRKHINTKVFNLVFVLLDVLFFFLWNLAMFPKGKLDDGFETLENISPLMFTLIPLTYFMKGKVKDYCFSAIAFLSVGMLVAMYASPEYEYVFTFRREADFFYTSEALCHMLCSLFGAYLVLTNQVKPVFSSWVKSIVFMYSIITFGVILNFVFHKGFFGMNPYGDYSIYMIDIFGSFEATLVAYYIGVLLVLTIGMQVNAGLDKLSARLHLHEALAPQTEQTEMLPIVETPAAEEVAVGIECAPEDVEAETVQND